MNRKRALYLLSAAAVFAISFALAAKFHGPTAFIGGLIAGHLIARAFLYA